MPIDQFDFGEKVKPETRQEIDFSAVARKYLDEKIPFCLIRFPHESNIEFYNLPQEKSKYPNFHIAVSGWNLTGPTFFYQPYRADDIDFPKGRTEIFEPKNPKETKFADYQIHFEKYQNAFASGTLQKAILSRIKNVTFAKGFRALDYFETLEKTYPKALVYILLHPTEGLWIGASPEILLRYHDKYYETISLAGTQSIIEKPYHWTEKEIEEQELVSQHIREQISASKAVDVQESKPHTVEAGSVAHLCSDFKFLTETSPDDFREIIDRLHPTPAIAGLPVAAAVAIINKTESHDRRLYTGTIGRKKAELVDYYVNLRCMQVFSDSVSLYLGGGITAGSTLQSEWDETEKKGKTLLNLMDYGE